MFLGVASRDGAVLEKSWENVSDCPRLASCSAYFELTFV